MTPPIRMVSVPVALPLKLIDTLKPLAVVAEKLKHCHVVEVCEPIADNPSSNIIPMPREWFERAADDLEAIAVLMHGAGILSEGQASTLTGLDRVEIRKQVDALTAAPVREEGGAVLRIGDRVSLHSGGGGTICNIRYGIAMDLEDGSPDLGWAPQNFLDTDANDIISATREEAPAEAGELAEAVERLTSAADFLEGDCVIVGDHEVRGDDLLAVLSTLRAQPQAREEAQPVARAHVYLNDDGLSADLEVLDGTHMQVEDSPVSLYLRPPAPEAEKLRVVVDAVRGVLAWDKARGYRMPYRVRDPLCAAIDLAALQQEGR
ncbi:hypothetical protein [Brevundimonas naejangsanensis]